MRIAAATECEAGPIRHNVALRFVLAYLLAIGRGDRRQFDELWRVIFDPLDWAHSEGQAERYRGSYARSALLGSREALGIRRRPRRLSG